MEQNISDEEFINDAFEKYGYRGRKQAQEVLRSVKESPSDREQLSASDLEFIREAMIDTFWNAKKHNRRYVNKRYRKSETTGQLTQEAVTI